MKFGKQIQTRLKLNHLLTAGLVLALAGCQSPMGSGVRVTSDEFGSANGKPVEVFTLHNARGMEVKLSTYGANIVSITAPDKKGNMADVVLGFDKAEDYVKNPRFFGAIVGRYGNRIAGGKFTLHGMIYNLAVNNGPNSLHGGVKGFDKVIWEGRSVVNIDGPAVEFKYVSKDGEEGYPGTLTVTALYTLSGSDNNLRLEITARTDKDTVVNLTAHPYFNLAGKGSILDHQIQINAGKFLPADSTSIPTGELKSVEKTPFDFRIPSVMGGRINQDDEQLKFGNGYDHCWVIDKPLGKFGLCAKVTEPTSGRVLEVWSTEPGMQFYTGNFLDGSAVGHGGVSYQKRNAFCLEPQHFPNSPNTPSFPTTVLKTDEVFRNTIVYKFSVKK